MTQSDQVPKHSNDNLSLCVKEGVLDAVKIGAAESYIGAFGIALGATPLQVGLISTLPPLIGAICQSIGVWSMELWQSRRMLLVRITRLQSVPLFLIGILGFLAPAFKLSSDWLIALSAIYFLTIGIMQPIWNSLVGDLILAEQRGTFFGVRNRWMAVTTLCSMLIAGQIISFADSYGYELLGFGVVFIIAGIFRWRSASLSARLENPIREISPYDRFTFWQFISRWRHSNFVRFVFFVGGMQFAVNIAAPFFPLYLLRSLNMSYPCFTAVIAVVLLAHFFVMQLWGRIGEQHGYRKILSLCALVVAFNPFLWLVSDNFYWLLGVQFFCGIFWAGFNTAAANFVFDAVTPQKLGRCFAYQAIIIGILVCLGSLCGGFLVESFSLTLQSLFVISGTLRLLAAYLFLPHFREVRLVRHISHTGMFAQVISLRPLSQIAFSFIERLPGKGQR